MVKKQGLKTQSEAFWRDAYKVDESDFDLLANVVLESGRPQALENLASTVILSRYAREKEAVAQSARRGRVYRPADSFEVGEELVFTAKDLAVGTVTAVREGRNPKFGGFSVISVAFDGAEEEFASGLDHPHPLNRPPEELLVGEDADLSEADMVRLYEHYVASKLEQALGENDDFVPFSSSWFLRDMLPEVHIGYLNLAEAAVYQAGHPLVAREMLADLDLEGSGSEEAQLFALNHALGEDERFDNVGSTASPIWYLKALEPEAVTGRPPVLAPSFAAAGGEFLGLTMLDMLDEIGDELDDVESTVFRQSEQVGYELSFPHWQAGTMPATMQFLRMLPVTSGSHYPITLVDGATDERFDVWVLPDERYVAGLGDWYRKVGAVVGTQVSVTPANAPGTFTISVAKLRGRRSEWIRSVRVEDDVLRLQMQRASVNVRVDGNMLVDVPDADPIAGYMVARQGKPTSIGALVREAFSELAKLSGRGSVHAKSLYSVINMMQRCGAVPVFAELTKNACFDPVGDGEWLYDEELDGKVYRTPDEMRDRPLSGRDDLVRDQVVQYVGR